jgi:CorA-like Mg2+ transporter protein
MFLVAELTVRTFQDAIRQERTTLDDLETSMLDGAERAQVLELHRVIRRVNDLRRTVTEYRDAVIDSNDDLEANPDEPALVRQLAGVHAQPVSALLFDLALLRDEVATAGELQRSLISTRQHTVINRLTVISALLLPLAVITGFYGMNFGSMVDAIGSPAVFILLGVRDPHCGCRCPARADAASRWLLALNDEDTARSGRRTHPSTTNTERRDGLHGTSVTAGPSPFGNRTDVTPGRVRQPGEASERWRW